MKIVNDTLELLDRKILEFSLWVMTSVMAYYKRKFINYSLVWYSLKLSCYGTHRPTMQFNR